MSRFTASFKQSVDNANDDDDWDTDADFVVSCCLVLPHMIVMLVKQTDYIKLKA